MFLAPFHLELRLLLWQLVDWLEEGRRIDRYLRGEMISMVYLLFDPPLVIYFTQDSRFC